MIKLSRKPKPKIVEDNQISWTDELLAAISAHGGYSKIPKEIKERLLIHYRHQDIKTPLFDSSMQKCAFCETKPGESGNIEVEHFAPKSKYPDRAFDWNNFLPSCRKCNGAKDDHDTLSEPIINPYDTDPEDVFYYKDIRIAAKENLYKAIAELTIETCELNSVRLMKPRADTLVSLHSFSKSLEIAIKDYNDASTTRIKRNKKRKIMEAVEVIESLAAPSEKLSGFCRDYLQNCEPFQTAKRIIETD